MMKYVKCVPHKNKMLLYKKNEKIFDASYICVIIIVIIFTFVNKNE